MSETLVPKRGKADVLTKVDLNIYETMFFGEIIAQIVIKRDDLNDRNTPADTG